MSDKKRLLDKMERPTAKRLDPEDYETPEEYQAALRKEHPEATNAVVGNENYDLNEKEGMGDKLTALVFPGAARERRQIELDKWKEAKAEHRKQKSQPDYFVRTIGKK